MISRADARQLVRQYIAPFRPQLPPDDELIILDDSTIEREWGWVFFYTSRRWFENKDHRYALGGNAPVIVNRFDGSLHPTGTALPIEEYIGEYEAQLERAAGSWALVIHDLPTTSKLSAIHQSMELELSQIAELRTALPGIVLRGARVDLAPILEKLRANGVCAEVRPSSDFPSVRL